MASTEQFIINTYSPESSCSSTNSLRVEIFPHVSEPERLPPTHDAVTFHVSCAHYQTMVWLQAHVAVPNIPPPEDHGWTCTADNTLLPQLTFLDAVSSVCTEILTCGCSSSRCASSCCTCKKNNLMCSAACRCKQDCLNQNISDDDSSDEDSYKRVECDTMC